MNLTTAIIIAMIIGLCQSLGRTMSSIQTPAQYPNMISYLFFYDINDE